MDTDKIVHRQHRDSENIHYSVVDLILSFFHLKLLRKVSFRSIFFIVLRYSTSDTYTGWVSPTEDMSGKWLGRHTAEAKYFPNTKNRPKKRLYTRGKWESERCLRLRASGQFSEKWNDTHIACITINCRETISECYPACSYLYYFIMNICTGPSIRIYNNTISMNKRVSIILLL